MSNSIGIQKAVEAFVRYGPWAWVIFQEAKDIRRTQIPYDNIAFTEMPLPTEMPGPSTISNNTSFSDNTVYKIRLHPETVPGPQKVEPAISSIDILTGLVPLFTTILSCLLNTIQASRSLSQLHQLNAHLTHISTTSRLRFTCGDSFPRHIYNFIWSEMKPSYNLHPSQTKPKPKSKSKSPTTSESFFILNPGSQWYPKFNRLCEENPLPDEFLGYFTNLDVLIALIQHVLRPALGKDMVFTILMPIETTSVSKEPIMLPRGLGPLRFKGELQSNGEPCMYLNLCKLENDTVLDGVGNLAKGAAGNCGRELVVSVAVLGTVGVYMTACLSLLAIPIMGIPLACTAWLRGAPRVIAGVTKVVQGMDCWKVNVRILGSEEVSLCDPDEL